MCFSENSTTLCNRRKFYLPEQILKYKYMLKCYISDIQCKNIDRALGANVTIR